ncbi:MAG: aquaporin Z [Betaproteobacteria bacterium]|nr:aquaporin Z [Betaproteobacteria bacterium]
MSSVKSLSAEFIGTFWLVFGGCGSALFAATFPETGIGFYGVAFAFGLTVLTMAFAIGHISGCHLNPAISLGLAVGGRFPYRMVLPYVVVQVLGALFAAALLYTVFMGQPSAEIGSFAANGYGEHSPGGYSMTAAIVMEVAMTAVFLFVIMGATDKRAPAGFAPIAIGLCLTLIHLVSIPVTNTSVNPARSTSQAIFASASWPLEQLWLFWAAPLIGGLIGALIYRFILVEGEGN